jgi:hypothetical protein
MVIGPEKEGGGGGGGWRRNSLKYAAMKTGNLATVVIEGRAVPRRGLNSLGLQFNKFGPIYDMAS